MRILSIDDSKAVHAVLDGMLTKISVEVAHVYDGPAGLNLLRQPGAQFDVVLLDWEMPIWNGLETLRQIRAAGLLVPVIMLTSKNNPADISAALNSGANEYAMKPFVSEIIYEKIESVLGRSIR